MSGNISLIAIRPPANFNAQAIIALRVTFLPAPALTTLAGSTIHLNQINYISTLLD